MSITAQKVYDIIARAKGIDASLIDNSKTFAELGINSINFVEIIMDIEEYAGGEFDDKLLSPVFFETVGDFADKVVKTL